MTPDGIWVFAALSPIQSRTTEITVSDLLLSSAAENFRSQIQSQLEWHIESRQAVCAVKLSSRNIMDGELAVPNDLEQLRYPSLSRILCLLGASDQISTIRYRKHNCPEKRRVSRVKWNINKDVASKCPLHGRKSFRNSSSLSQGFEYLHRFLQIFAGQDPVLPRNDYLPSWSFAPTVLFALLSVFHHVFHA